LNFNGDISEEDEEKFFEDGMPYSLFRELRREEFENCFFYHNTTYVDGTVYLTRDMSLLNGVVKDFYQNGQLAIEKNNYKNGELDGYEKLWRKDGELSYEKYWKNGKAHGIERDWGRNGKLNSERFYKDGMRVGEWKRWHFNGKLKYEGIWEDDKEVSKKYWDENGKRTKKIIL